MRIVVGSMKQDARKPAIATSYQAHSSVSFRAGQRLGPAATQGTPTDRAAELFYAEASQWGALEGAFTAAGYEVNDGQTVDHIVARIEKWTGADGDVVPSVRKGRVTVQWS